MTRNRDDKNDREQSEDVRAHRHAPDQYDAQAEAEPDFPWEWRTMRAERLRLTAERRALVIERQRIRDDLPEAFGYAPPTSINFNGTTVVLPPEQQARDLDYERAQQRISAISARISEIDDQIRELTHEEQRRKDNLKWIVMAMIAIGVGLLNLILRKG